MSTNYFTSLKEVTKTIPVIVKPETRKILICKGCGYEFDWVTLGYDQEEDMLRWINFYQGENFKSCDRCGLPICAVCGHYFRFDNVSRGYPLKDFKSPWGLNGKRVSDGQTYIYPATVNTSYEHVCSVCSNIIVKELLNNGFKLKS